MPARSIRWRCRRTARQLPPQQAGFLLPLSLTVVLLLMLSSMVLLTLALQSRLQAAVQRQRRQTEDQLMNAAQLWAGGVQRHCPEALAHAHDRWDGQPLGTEQGCGGLEAGADYRLVSYAPGGDPQPGTGPDQGTGELVLELSDAEPAPRGAFALHWRRQPVVLEPQGEEGATTLGPPQLMGLEERGLRAAAAAAAGASELEVGP